MRFDQTWKPNYSYCLYCGKETESETCGGGCTGKLTAVRNAVSSQKEHEKQTGFGKSWTDRTIKKYNELMELLDKK